MFGYDGRHLSSYHSVGRHQECSKCLVNCEGRMRNQLKFFRWDKVSFGGGNRNTNPTRKRPFSKKCDVHVVLKSKHAIGNMSFLRPHNKRAIKEIIDKFAKRFF